MKLRFLTASAVACLLLGAASLAAADTTPLAVSCAGVASASSITWTATPSGGVAPYSFLWGTGATSSSVTVSETPGTYTMNVQATDASSTVSTSTCSATVASPVSPSITAFTATPSSILLGSSSVLAWTVSNASSTSLDNGIGAVSSTSVTVFPAVTTTYTLTATNPNGSVTATALVTVGTTTSGGGSLQQQIQALLQEIAALQQQVAQLIASRFGGGTGSSTPPFIPPGQVGKFACMNLGRNLREGDSGGDVMKLQQILASDPSSGFNASTTGFFGPLTARALIRFQLQNGIVSSENETDGSAGTLTRGFFNRACGEGLLKQGSAPWVGSSSPTNWSNDSVSSSSMMQGDQRGNSDGQGNDNGHGNSGQHGNPFDH